MLEGNAADVLGVKEVLADGAAGPDFVDLGGPLLLGKTDTDRDPPFVHCLGHARAGGHGIPSSSAEAQLARDRVPVGHFCGVEGDGFAAIGVIADAGVVSADFLGLAHFRRAWLCVVFYGISSWQRHSGPRYGYPPGNSHCGA